MNSKVPFGFAIILSSTGKKRVNKIPMHSQDRGLVEDYGNDLEKMEDVEVLAGLRSWQGIFRP